MKRGGRAAACLLMLIALAGADPRPEKPGMNVYPADEAERPKFKRAYRGAPPVLTHGAREMRVTLKSNDCMDCHTPPPSHYLNPYQGKKATTHLVRYNCQQCHVPQALEK